MYVIIGGAGDAGRYLAKLLSNQGNEVAIVEKNKEVTEEITNIDALIINGDVCDYRDLLEAGINDCDYYIGLVKEDSTNLISCSIANFYGCQTIARVSDPSLAREPVSRRYTPVGVDISLCPSLITSQQISRVFSFPRNLKKLDDVGINYYQFTVEKNSKFDNKKIKSLGIPDGSKIVTVFRGIKQILPTDDFLLKSEDELCIFTDQRVGKEKLEEFIESAISPYSIVNNVFIAGLSDISMTLAEKLIESNISVTIMDLSNARTKTASERFPKANVIRADPLGHGVLLKEGIEKFDLLMATGMSLERNIFISILAKKFNVPRAISLIDRIDLKESIEGTLVDSGVVPNLLLVNSIINILSEEKTKGRFRRNKIIPTRTIQTKPLLSNEIKVTKRIRCVNKKIKNFTPDLVNFSIPVIIKDKKGFIPSDDYIIKDKDRLFVLYHSSAYETVKRWLVG